MAELSLPFYFLLFTFFDSCQTLSHGSVPQSASALSHTICFTCAQLWDGLPPDECEPDINERRACSTEQGDGVLPGVSRQGQQPRRCCGENHQVVDTGLYVHYPWMPYSTEQLGYLRYLLGVCRLGDTNMQPQASVGTPLRVSAEPYM